MLLERLTASDLDANIQIPCPHFMITEEELNNVVPITDSFINAMADYMARIQVPLTTSVGTSASTSREIETQTTPTEESPTGSYSNLQDCYQEIKQENDDEDFLSANSDNVASNSNEIDINVGTQRSDTAQEANIVSSTVSEAVPPEPTPPVQERAGPSHSGRHRHRRSR